MSSTWRSSRVMRFGAAIGIAIALAACGNSGTLATTASTSSTTSEVADLEPPFRTLDGIAWLTAACGSPSVMDASPNSWLPGADPVALCLTPPGREEVLVGVYDDPDTAAADMKAIDGRHGHATRVADDGRTWVFVVDPSDTAALVPLEKFAFDLS